MSFTCLTDEEHQALVRRAEAAEAQRDKLLTAAKAVQKAFDVRTWENMLSWDDEPDGARLAFSLMLDAIAEAEKPA